MKGKLKNFPMSRQTFNGSRAGRFGAYDPRKDRRSVFRNALKVIWEYYIAKLKEHTRTIREDPSALILKTDCDNEIHNHPRQGGIVGNAQIEGKYTLIEIDPAKVRKARIHGYEAVEGDIRHMPFNSLRFDMVFDFSTIDHIPPGDVELVLKEYHRVLKSGGSLYLVAWCSYKSSYHEPEFEQYYFEYCRFRKKVERYFRIRDGEMLYVCGGILFLTAFLCKKKKLTKPCRRQPKRGRS